MRSAWKLAVVVIVTGASTAGVVGCVSDNNSPPPAEDASTPLVDGSQPLVDSTAPATDSGADGAPLPDSSAPDTNVPDTAPLPALVRFAWFVGGAAAGLPVNGVAVVAKPDGVAALGVDVCVAPHGTGVWQGPLLAQSSLANGMQAFDVTSYFPVPAGQYDARIVPAGGGCDLPDAGASGTVDAGEDGAAGDAGAPVDSGSPPSSEFDSLPAVAAGAALTVVLVDPANPSATIADVVTLTDATSTSAGSAGLRFVNVSGLDNYGKASVTDSLRVRTTARRVRPAAVIDAGSDAGVDAGPLGADFGLGGGNVFSPLFSDVTSAEQLAPAASAANGYVEVAAPLSGIDGTLLPSSGSLPTAKVNPLSTDSLSLAPGGLFTAFYASESAATAGGARVPVLVWCYDGAPSAASTALTSCEHTDTESQSTTSGTRFGNFLADPTAAATDVCVKYHSYGAYVGPLMSTLTTTATGIPSQSLSGYFYLDEGFAFDVRFVPAGAGDCTTSVADDTFTTFTESGGGYTSVLLTGYTTVPSDAGTIPPYDAGAPYDGGPDAAAQPVSTGLTTLAKSVVAIEDEPWSAPETSSVRVVHLSADHPQPITLVASQIVPSLKRLAPEATGDLWQIDDVPYGGFSTQPPPVDPFGYLTVSTTEANLALDANTWTYTPGGDQTSLFAFDNAGGTELLSCNDYDEYDYSSTAGIYTCCVVNADGTCNGSGGGDDE